MIRYTYFKKCDSLRKPSICVSIFGARPSLATWTKSAQIFMIFQLCYFITIFSSHPNKISTINKMYITGSNHCTQNSHSRFCDSVYFVPTWSTFTGSVTFNSVVKANVKLIALPVFNLLVSNVVRLFSV